MLKKILIHFSFHKIKLNGVIYYEEEIIIAIIYDHGSFGEKKLHIYDILSQIFDLFLRQYICTVFRRQ